MEYEQTNRDRRLEARRRMMRVTGRGLLTVVVPIKPTKVTERMIREARKKGRPAPRAA